MTRPLFESFVQYVRSTYFAGNRIGQLQRFLQIGFGQSLLGSDVALVAAHLGFDAFARAPQQLSVAPKC